MPPRVRALLLACALLAAPAAVLRGVCAGRSCAHAARGPAPAPFCSLPHSVRVPLRNGFREGRSPEILAVAQGRGVVGGTGFDRSLRPPWPSRAVADRSLVPISFWGPGIEARRLPDGFGLDDVAPTLAGMIGLRRPHPEVRSGTGLPSLWTGPRPRLAVEVVLRGLGAPELAGRGWPTLQRLVREGAASERAPTGSLPLDPTATLTTIGTGGLPRQHGVTGTLIRNDGGRLVRAWGRFAPPSVIATLADDLDQAFAQRARIGAVVADPADRGLIGKRWYPGADEDDVIVTDAAVPAALRLLASGYGTDGAPDLLAVAASGEGRAIDRGLARIAAAARRAAGDRFVLVVTATGSTTAAAGAPPPVGASAVVRRLAAALDAPVGRTRPGGGIIEAAAAGGLFLDQRALAERSLSDEQILRALGSVRAGARPLFEDRFPAIAVSFARYC